MLISLFHMRLWRCNEGKNAAPLEITAIVNKYRGFQKKTAENTLFWGGSCGAVTDSCFSPIMCLGAGEGCAVHRTFFPNECIKMIV